MKKSRVFTLGVACFFCAITALGFVPFTSTGGATASSNSANLAGAAQLGDSALTPQEQLLNGTWECNPETDPIIYTTDYGLDIRWSMAGLPSGTFMGYAYIKHGGKNWAIIGYSNKTKTLSSGELNLANLIKYYSYYTLSGYDQNSIWQWAVEESSTPAKNAIWNEYSLVSKDVIYSLSSVNAILKSALFPNAVCNEVTSAELEANEVLCFCQDTIGSSYFNATGSNRYYGSTLKTTIDTFYENNMTDLPIVGKALTTTCYGETDSTSITASNPAYMFPLAGVSSTETFYYDHYSLGSNIRINTDWWLRSGHPQSAVAKYYSNAYGFQFANYLNHSTGVRPAFVLEI